MDIEKFEILKRNYEKFIQEAERAIHQESAKQQTRSVWFDRQTIEKLLDQTDPKQGGIKIYLGMYDKDTVSEQGERANRSDYIGKLTVILTASNDNDDPGQQTMIVNGGKVCPPDC
jgi:hypothetical protein